MTQTAMFSNQWAVVELTNGEQFRGKVSEKADGIPMLRVDVPAQGDGKAYTTFIAPGSLRSVELITPDEGAENAGKTHAGLKVHTIGAVECYVSGSGNTTWKAYDEDQAIIYLRQANREMLIEAGLWDQLNLMTPGDQWDALIFIHTIPDGDFRKPIEIGEGAKVINPGTLPEVEPGISDDKKAAIEWAKALLAKPFVIFDTETTGFENDDQIIQIGVIDQDGKTVLETLIKPTKPILNSQYHGITDEMVKDAPEFAAVYDQIAAALDGKTVVAYNLEYDQRMVRQEWQRCDLAPLVYEHGYCAMVQYAQYNGDWNSYHGNYRWVKLRDALAEFGLKHEDFGEKEHDACTDARATLGLIKEMAGQKAKESKLPF